MADALRGVRHRLHARDDRRAAGRNAARVPASAPRCWTCPVSIDWINPAALAGLAAIAGPVVVHLLRRQRAPRVTFPTIQFLAPTRAAAARFRRPSDLLLLCLRVAIVAAAAIAAAQPVLVTGWRRAAWEQRVSRALVVDDTRKPVCRRIARARCGRRRARRDRRHVSEIRTTDLADGLKQAAAMLRGRRCRPRRDCRDLRLSVGVADGCRCQRCACRHRPAIRRRGCAASRRRVSGTASISDRHEPGDRAARSPSTAPALASRCWRLRPPPREVAILSPPEQRDAVASLRRIVAGGRRTRITSRPWFDPDLPGRAAARGQPADARVGWCRAFVIAGADEHLRCHRRQRIGERMHPRSFQPAVGHHWHEMRSGHPLVSRRSDEAGPCRVCVRGSGRSRRRGGAPCVAVGGRPAAVVAGEGSRTHQRIPAGRMDPRREAVRRSLEAPAAR